MAGQSPRPPPPPRPARRASPSPAASLPPSAARRDRPVSAPASLSVSAGLLQGRGWGAGLGLLRRNGQGARDGNQCPRAPNGRSGSNRKVIGAASLYCAGHGVPQAATHPHSCPVHARAVLQSPHYDPNREASYFEQVGCWGHNCKHGAAQGSGALALLCLSCAPAISTHPRTLCTADV